ncbi:hypothetical protein [Spirosoma foliorum]|uniref:Uncharacterized protein n=1 Tax=Spirosoma foliorum TaxID=2710596 RepID=A0A7G5H2R0_9BACT|nr:hypothetical protein [Spirosoma foliorum]QMW05402.1 hypothetical protein H3H32_11165 [Spirosoma foliorum]
MATLEDMYARHDREMKNLMKDQQISWNVLNERYGKGNIPTDVYQQWDQQHGNTRLHGLRAQHQAELEAYPLNPLEYRYQQEKSQKEKDPTPDIFEQLKQKQQPVQDISSKQSQPNPQKPDPDDVFAALRRKQQEQDRHVPGDDDR